MERHTDPGLYWPIKRSFVQYVLRIADGQVMGAPGVTVVDAGTFVFAPAASEGDEAGGALAFRGELRLQAHAGALAVRIANPRVDLSGERGTLLIDDPGDASRPLIIASFSAEQDLDDPTRWLGSDVRLAVDAVPLFGGYYGEGEPLDDLVIVAPARP